MLPIKNTTRRYGIISQLFHWGIAILFFANFYLVYRRDYIPETNPDHLAYILLHKSFGVLLIILGVLFLAWRLYNSKPALPHETKRWEMRLAKSVHHFLWILIILMPISGILMSAFAGRPASFFGLFTIPEWVTPNESWAGFFYQTHGLLSYAIIGVVALHIIGALRHHFWLKDNVLRSMLPLKLK